MAVAWTAEQLHNAQVIINVGRRVGASRRDVVIALMAAMQESGLRNLDYGDRDSIGLFQQRAAWGSFAQRHDPATAARMFFLGGHQGQRGLLDFSARDQMTPSQAAQAVQVSAYPDAYAKWLDDAHQILQGHGGGLGPADQSNGLVGGIINAIDTTVNTVTNDVTDAAFDPKLATHEQKPGDVSRDYLRPAIQQTDSGTPGIGAYQAPDSLADYSDQAFTFPTNKDGTLDLSSVGVGGAHGAAAGWRGRVRRIAHQYLGTPYVWGGTSPDGFDCSGFVQYVYKQMGVDLPRISFQQANYGHHISLDDLRVGDLVAWDNSRRNNGADHIAIYIGHGRIIEAPRPGLSVQVSNLYDTDQAWGVRMHR